MSGRFVKSVQLRSAKGQGAAAHGAPRRSSSGAAPGPAHAALAFHSPAPLRGGNQRAGYFTTPASTSPSESARSVAARGTRGTGSTLPHLSEVQAAFGRHDVSATRAHVGGEATDAARSLGADAFATGGDIAFRRA